MKPIKIIKFVLLTIFFVLTLQTVALPQSQTEKIYQPNEVDVKIKIKEKPRAQYTDRARKNCTNGIVTLKAIFKSTGKIENIEVVSGLPDGLSESAMKAARKIRFQSAEKNGQKVSVAVKIEYDFDYSQILPCENGKRTR